MSEPKISLEEVKHVSILARLRLDEREAQQMRKELDGILEYVSSLQSLDLTNTPPTLYAATSEVRLRADQPERILGRDEALAQAPETHEQGFAVPKVLDAT